MLTLLLTLLATAEGPQDDLKAMQGTWVLVSSADGLPGKKTVTPTDRSFRLSVRGDQTIGSQGIKTGAPSAFILDPTKTPKRIASFFVEGGQLTRLKGIYELDGDVMRSSFSPPGEDRPTSFPETPATINVYEREKPRP